MSLINTNTIALTSARRLDQVQEMLGRSLNRLSSGSKIVNPSDDAAGLAVSEKLSAQNKRVSAATTNVQNAISYVQTNDGYLGSMAGILSRLSELAIMAKDPTKNAEDVDLYNREFDALRNQLRETVGGTTSEIGGTADITSPLGMFNGITLFGPNSGGIKVTIGQAVGQDMTVPATNLRTGSMLDIINQDATGAYTLSIDDAGTISTISDAVQQIATERATIGASQSRLELASSTLAVENENLQAAVSRIRDVDVAQESTNYAKYNMLVQSSTAMLAQANLMPQSVLRLLRQ